MTVNATILPMGETQFCDTNGVPLAGGSVYFYIPATTTPKTTWQDDAQSVPNSNPVILDSAGRAIIFGSGVYRQIVKDSLGNTIWDQITLDPLSAALSSILASNNTWTGTNTWQNTSTFNGTSDFNGQVGIGASPHGGFALTVVAASVLQLYVGSTGANGSNIFIDNAAGGQESQILFLDAGVNQWALVKETDNSFALVDTLTSNLVIHAISGGTLSLGEAGNFTIDNSGNARTLTQAANTNNTTIATTQYVDRIPQIKAWVNFDGTVGSPTPRASSNISSLTKSATGSYIMNFTTPLVDANYAAMGMGGFSAANGALVSIAMSTTSFHFGVWTASTGVFTDGDHIMCSIVR